MGNGTTPGDHTTPPEGIEDPEGVGGGDAGPDENNCWDFELIDCTEIVDDIKVGTEVKGAPGERLLVLCDYGPLGIAPEQVAQAVASRLQKTPTLRLAGKVLQIDRDRDAPTVIVRLCLL